MEREINLEYLGEQIKKCEEDGAKTTYIEGKDNPVNLLTEFNGWMEFEEI